MRLSSAAFVFLSSAAGAVFGAAFGVSFAVANIVPAMRVEAIADDHMPSDCNDYDHMPSGSTTRRRAMSTLPKLETGAGSQKDPLFLRETVVPVYGGSPEYRSIL